MVTGGTPPVHGGLLGAEHRGPDHADRHPGRGQRFAVTGLQALAQTVQITVKDSSTNQQVLVRTITCQ